MKGAALHQRLACGATPRRCWPTLTRPGTRVCVIVPSKDSSSGSSGKRVPLLWTFPDAGGSSRGVLKHKQALEEVFSRDVAEAPFTDTPAPNPVAAVLGSEQPQAQVPFEMNGGSEAAASHYGHRHHHCLNCDGHQQQQHRAAQVSAAPAAVPSTAAGVEGDVVVVADLEPAALRERIASAAGASTSAPAAAGPGFGSRSEGGGRSHHHHHRNQIHHASASTAPLSPRAASSNGAVASVFAGGPTGASALSSPLARVDLLGSSSQRDSNSTEQQHQVSHHQSHIQQQQQQQDQQQQHQQHQQQYDLNRHSDSNHHQHVGSSSSNCAASGHHLPAVALNGSSQPPAGKGPAAASPVAPPSVPAPAAAAAAAAPRGDQSIPGSIWILCFISAALTCASCVFNTALPIYMVSELKMSMRSMGMFEGLLEAFSYVVRMCSGVVSDRMTSRKAAITLGFAAGAAAKFGMASAGTVGLLFAGKAVDRLANGIQAAPRDALIGDLSPPGARSACFGLAQSLRKWGSAVGALAAFFLMKASNNNYQLIFYSAAAVSLTACLAFVVLVPAHTRAPAPQAQPAKPTEPAAAAAGAAGAAAATTAFGGGRDLLSGVREFARSVASMGSDFYRMLGVISLYALGHINESLLEARAMEVGFGKAEATLVVAAIAAVTFLTAYPLGRLDDRYGAGTTFAVGIGALIAGDLVLLLSGPHPLALFAACLFLGVHWAVIQGPLLSIVSGLAPAHMRGTAFGIFYTIMAVTAVAANTMYGSIWHTYGANAAFATSAALMSVVLAALPYMLPACARRGTGAAPNSLLAAAAPSPTAAIAPLASAGPLGGLVAVPGLGGSGNGGKASGLGGSALPAAA